MDEADRAQEEQERFEAMTMSRRFLTLKAVGRCHFCDEEVADGRLFCDNAIPGDRGCAQDWERGHKESL